MTYQLPLYRSLHMKNDLSNVKCTLFVEDTLENAKEILKLIRLIAMLGGGENPETAETHYDREDIETFFTNPLANLLVDDNPNRHVSAEILVGQLKLPAGLLDHLPLEDHARRRALRERWQASSLLCTAYPRWGTICQKCIVLFEH